MIIIELLKEIEACTSDISPSVEFFSDHSGFIKFHGELFKFTSEQGAIDICKEIINANSKLRT